MHSILYYHPKIGGVATSANYAADLKQFGGLVIDTCRRIVPTDPDGRSLREPVFMNIDVLDVRGDS